MLTVCSFLALLSLAIHTALAAFYLYVVSAHFTLGNYILDAFNLLVALVAHFFHFNWFIQYNDKSYFLPLLVQSIASIWQFTLLTDSTISKKQPYNDESFLITIGSLSVLAAGIYRNLGQCLNTTYQKVNQECTV